jgi:NACalpha-BTF3-like transcription factor
MFNLQAEAKKIITEKKVDEKGIDGLTLGHLKPMVLWKLQKKSLGSMKKADMVKAWNDTVAPEEVQEWSAEKENELKDLLLEDIDIMDTQVGVEAAQMVNAVSNCVNDLSEEQVSKLEGAIRQRAILQAAKDRELRDSRRDQAPTTPLVLLDDAAILAPLADH